MSYRDTTVKRELIKLNNEVEDLVDRAEGSNDISEQTLDALNELGRDIQTGLEHINTVREHQIAEWRDTIADLRQDIITASVNVKNGLSKLGGDIVAGLVGGALIHGTLSVFGSALRAAVDLRIHEESQPEYIFQQKKIRALEILSENQPISLGPYTEQLLFQGFSEHDAKYIPLGLLDRGTITSRGEGPDALVTPNESSEEYQELMRDDDDDDDGVYHAEEE
jgi:hypothetical protein